MKRSHKFTPWHVDYWWGIACLVLAMFSGWGMVYWGHSFMGVALSAWLTAKGLRRVSCGLARERGIEVEQRAVQRLRDSVVAGGYDIQADVLMTYGGLSYGNIDLVVSPVWTQARYVVEIKSFSGIVHRWGSLFREGKFYRLWSPQKQVRGQCRYLGQRWHFPVLWLPESKLGTWIIFKGNLLVVNGGVEVLLYGLEQFDAVIKLPVIVRFPSDPGEGFTRNLLKRGFKYDSRNWCWHGSISKSCASELSGFIQVAGGRIEWLQP
ncbi:MAG: nuclease-related domain-containing protein [Candidatus Paceibacterota bacterium]|jgi:hypothetical protein